jgi:hypothetical protein
MTHQPLNRPCGVDVVATLDGLLTFASRGVERDDPARELIEDAHEARAAVAELIEQRDALVTALAELTRALPKGSKSLSHIARRRTCDAERLAWSILNREAVSPDAYDRALAKAGVP